VKFPHQDSIEDRLEQLKEIADEVLFKDWHVTEALKSSVLDRIAHTENFQPTSKWRWLRGIGAGALAVSVLGVSFLMFIKHDGRTVSSQQPVTSQPSQQPGSLTVANARSERSPTVPVMPKQVEDHQDRKNVEDNQDRQSSVSSVSSESNVSRNGTETQGNSSKQLQATKNQTPIPANQADRAQNQSMPTHNQAVSGQNNEGVTKSLTDGLATASAVTENMPVANGPVMANHIVAGLNATVTSDPVQQLFLMANGNPIVAGFDKNGKVSVYILPASEKEYYGWLEQGKIGIYVLPSWKLPIQLDPDQWEQIVQSANPDVIRQYQAIETQTIPAHSPYLNPKDPIRELLLQLAARQRLFAVYGPDGSVAFFSDTTESQPNQVIVQWPNPSLQFVIRILDPTLYFYPGVSTLDWDQLQKHVTWLTVDPRISSTFQTTLMSYPLYP
jgi:hypothetical protein